MNTGAGFDTGNTGLPTSGTDVNNQSTHITTYDSMLRPGEIDYPDQGKTLLIYGSPNNRSIYKLQSSSMFWDKELLLEGYGRISREAILNDNGNWYQQGICYDGNGNVYFRSYAYTNSGWGAPKVCSGAGDRYSYDVLSRPRSVTHSDNSSSSISYQGNLPSLQTRILLQRSRRRMASAASLPSAN